ncbi:hypothetical protein AM500_04760 [Bacillus sp. FJAT-18017]|uniref:DUF3953 domain-containing protein n=1 Tax=Bacillus sp. FJAT-18017 TaxID=1705566 RepID=UPI0006AEF266|nr:DUF3953 domain-containing protein [Bacillus sp. FJAT-18017]ALC89177.1 hypothetical protein AM500_04760 [Bacillus sp. FJAT-18017]
MLKFLQIIFTITAISLAGYVLITEDYKFNPVTMLFWGLTLLVIGLRVFQKGHKAIGWLSIAVFIFMIFVLIKSYLLK